MIDLEAPNGGNKWKETPFAAVIPALLASPAAVEEDQEDIVLPLRLRADDGCAFQLC